MECIQPSAPTEEVFTRLAVRGAAPVADGMAAGSGSATVG
jgi:hypothetical protein